ncbi:ATP-grasp ribosomal peptide maturase [Actinomadura roseirufa]|uniref:ATP-grasp ribosomal peptide maturase n=1 Tax=Actinomadura roseirufa TaxID=2094049 RepID=UPI0010418A75|nr:ATP-grasp ribosomal peptide maturase [Actinomadura roseirufa]
MAAPRPVLVVTQPDDLTADMVIDELNRRKVGVVRLDSADFPHTVTLSARIDNAGVRGTVVTGSRCAELENVRSLYYRRPRGFRFRGSDRQDARFAVLQARYGFGGVLASLPDCLYVNHPHAIADCEFKPAQLAAAAEVGFSVPATLITNDPGQARAFAAEHAPVVYKPLHNSPYRQDGRPRTIWVTEVDPAELDESVRGTAHLFQARVPTTAFLRVTAVGERLFCVRIDSDLLDWRYDYSALTYAAVPTPADVTAPIRAFLARFNLVFGCFDLALRPDGAVEFLECNANGQFAWLQEHTGLPMTAAVADLLAQGLP